MRLLRIGCRLPPLKLAGVAAEPEHAARTQRLEFANEAGVLRREECRVHKLLHFVREPDVILWHVRAIRLGRNSQGNLRRALRAKARGGNTHRSSSKKTAPAGSTYLDRYLRRRHCALRFSHFSIDGIPSGTPLHEDETSFTGVPVLCKDRLNLQEDVP